MTCEWRTGCLVERPHLHSTFSTKCDEKCPSIPHVHWSASLPHLVEQKSSAMTDSTEEDYEPASEYNRKVQTPAPTSVWEELGKEIGKLVNEKQKAYGDSFGRSGDVMRQLYPNGITPAQYYDALAVVRIIDKLFRIASQKNAFGESPYRDIVGYGLLGAAKSLEDVKF